MSDRHETQQRLIDATRLIMVTRGVEGCTLERITQAANFTRGAFYSNFDSKEELFIAVAEEEYRNGIASIAAFTERLKEQLGDLPPVEKISDDYLQLILSEVLVQFLTHMRLNRAFFILHSEFLIRSARVPEWAEQFSSINHQFVITLSETLALIMEHLGRQFVWSGEAVAQAVIGIVLRANGIASWKHDTEHGSPMRKMLARQQVTEQTLVAQEVATLIIPLLIACSAPVSPASR